ncbi:MAG: SEC-C metal-binding domain-containing protein, partial [Acidobacteriota bacterium]|nr:SEC-C metal-binding domain-containing protein [Acidobacteriota bacterium]
AQASVQDLTRNIQRKKEKEMDALQFVGGDGTANLTQTIVKGDKTGRNDPCPCGSGKKFKKCHGA